MLCNGSIVPQLDELRMRGNVAKERRRRYVNIEDVTTIETGLRPDIVSGLEAAGIEMPVVKRWGRLKVRGQLLAKQGVFVQVRNPGWNVWTLGSSGG